MTNIGDQELFKKYATCSKLEQELKEQKQPHERISKEKIQVRNKLVENNQALVAYMINKYYNRSEYMKIKEDLLQEGTIGLMSAIDGYDITLGYKFSTYASWWIRQSINAFLSGAEPIIQVPAHVRSAQSKILKEIYEDKEKSGKNEITSEEFNKALWSKAKKYGYTDKMVESIICSIDSKKVTSFDKKVKSSSFGGDEGTKTLKDLYPEKNKTSPFQKIDNSKLVKSVAKSLNKLSDKHLNVLLLRFAFENEVTQNNED